MMKCEQNCKKWRISQYETKRLYLTDATMNALCMHYFDVFTFFDYILLHIKPKIIIIPLSSLFMVKYVAKKKGKSGFAINIWRKYLNEPLLKIFSHRIH